MCPQKVGTVSAAVKNSAEDSPQRASVGRYTISPRDPGRGVRMDLKISNKEAGMPGRAGSPLHAESATPTGMVAPPYRVRQWRRTQWREVAVT
jgi:hypothetical protein